jgi:hypothetical protein
LPQKTLTNVVNRRKGIGTSQSGHFTNGLFRPIDYYCVVIRRRFTGRRTGNRRLTCTAHRTASRGNVGDMTGRDFIEPAVWWVVLLATYLAVISKISATELIVGALASAAAAAAAVLTRRALLSADNPEHYWPHPGWYIRQRLPNGILALHDDQRMVFACTLQHRLDDRRCGIGDRHGLGGKGAR